MPVNPRSLRVYLGTYTTTGQTGSRGIYTARFDPESGQLTEATLAAATPDPSFLALAPGGRTLYAVEESGAKVHGFAVGEGGGDGTLLRLDATGDTGGGAPCDVAVHPDGRWLVVANYSGGSVAVFPLDAAGRIGPRAGLHVHTGSSVHPKRQKEPHAHGVTFSPDGRFLLVPDLGLDQVKIYRVDDLSAPAVGAWSIAPGSGPRHAAFSRDGRHLYVVNELANTVTVGRYEPETAGLETVQTISTLPEGGFAGETATAEIAVHPATDRFVYASNRGHDSIAVFARELAAADGRLTRVENVPTGGRTPRHFALSPDGRWLLAGNQKSGAVNVFRVDETSGRLTATARGATDVPGVVCIVFAR